MNRLARSLASLAILCVPAGLAAQDTEWNRYTLEDLGGVFVSASVDEVCQETGVSEGSVQVLVEATLAVSDVELLTRGEMLRNPGLPELRVSVGCVTGGAGTVGYHAAIRVQQSAQMTRDSQITLAEAVTWYATGLGVTDMAEGKSAIEATVIEKVEEFAAAYVAANGAATEPPESGSDR